MDQLLPTQVYVRPPVTRHHVVTGTRQGWGKLRNLKHKGMLNWLRMFGTVRTQKLSDEMREQAFALATEKLRDVQYINGHWYADYRRLRIVARKI